MTIGKDTKFVCNATASATGPQPGVVFQLVHDTPCTAQAEVIGGAASFVIEGRLSPDAPWVTVPGLTPSPVTASGAIAIARGMPEMRVNITTNPGTIRVWIMA